MPRFRRARSRQHDLGLTLVAQRTSLLGQGLLDQVLLQQPGVARVGLEDGVGNVAQEGHEAHGKVHCDVEHHAGLQRGRQAALDLLGLAEDEEVGHEAVEHISNPGVYGVSRRA